MNLSLFESVYYGLKDFVKTNSKIPITVLKKPNGDSFPRIIFSEISNVGLSNVHFTESYSLVGFEADIFAESIQFEGELIDSMEVAKYISGLVSSYLDTELKFKRVMCNPTPNYDITKHRITMRYTAKASDYRGHFF